MSEGCCWVIVVFWYKNINLGFFGCKRASNDKKKKHCMFRRGRVINGVDF